MNQHQFLEGPEGSGNARFGSAIAALSDINMDGFNDVIIGSPVENENSGAVYIYNGHQGTIRTKYSQVTMNNVKTGFINASARQCRPICAFYLKSVLFPLKKQ